MSPPLATRAFLTEATRATGENTGIPARLGGEWGAAGIEPATLASEGVARRDAPARDVGGDPGRRSGAAVDPRRRRPRADGLTGAVRPRMRRRRCVSSAGR